MIVVNKDIFFGQSSHIHTIEKNSIHKKKFGSIKKSDIKVDITPKKFEPFINVKELGNAFDIGMIWDNLKMEAPVEKITIKIKYKDTIHHIFNVRLSYVKENPLVTPDFTTYEVPWGADLPCCHLHIRSGEDNKPNWAYKTEKTPLNICIISPDFYNKDTLPNYIPVNTEIIIPLYYKYQKPIRSSISKELIVNVNGKEKKTSINFTQSIINKDDIIPSFTLLRNVTHIGNGIIDIATVSLDSKHSYIDITESDIVLKSPITCINKRKTGKNRWTLSVDTDKIKELPNNPIQVNLSFLIGKNNLYDEIFYISSKEMNPDKKYILLILQNSFVISPKIKNNSTIYYTQDEKIKIPFEIKNTSDKEVEKICIKLENDCLGNILMFSNNKKELIINKLKKSETFEFEVIIPDASCLENVKLLSANICPYNEYQDNLAQQYSFCYNIAHKLLPNIYVEGNIINNSLFVNETYNNEPLCTVTIHNLSYDDIPNQGVNDIDISKLSVDQNNFYLSPDNGCIACGEKKDITLYFSSTINNKEYENNIVIINLYYEEELINSIKIPFRSKKYVGPFPTSEPINDELRIIYPKPNEPKIIDILHCYFDDDEIKSTINNPKIIIQNPYCINGQPTLHELSLSDLPTFTICLNCEALNFDFINIDSDLHIPYKFLFTDDTAIEEHIEEGIITLVPSDLSAKKEIDFEDEYGNTYKISYSLFCHKYSLLETGTLRLRLGTFKVSNLTEYEWKDERVSIFSPFIQIYELDSNDTYNTDDNLAYSENLYDISIPNGHNPENIEVWLDINKWKEHNCPKKLLIVLSSKDKNEFDHSNDERNDNEKLIEEFCIGVSLEEIVDNDIYSLDLGTTGIVIAKEHDGEISLLKLIDKEKDAIESDPHILSSIVLLKKKTNEESHQNNNDAYLYDSFELAPCKSDYTGDKGYHVIVPSKFIIGQDKIPFEKNLDDGEIDAFGQIITYSQKEGKKSCNQIIGCLYKHIFKDKIKSEDKSQIKKLIVTYPNTYSHENIEDVKRILIDEVGLLPQNITFIPESDAAAAYYFSYRIENNELFDNKKETVVIYDMGAGTLDVSVVDFIRKDNNITANIKKKIGIPIAGNYLDYMIYIQLKKYGILKVKDDDIELSEKITKEFITKYKKTYPEIQEISQDTYTSSDSNTEIQEANIQDTYQDYIDFNKLEERKTDIDIHLFVEICTKILFETLKLSKENVDKVILSGRGSQFKPIKDAIEEYFADKIIEPIPNYLGGNLKTCVAIGALKYLQYFDETTNANYRIVNQNQYLKIGVVFRKRIQGGQKTEYLVLLDPDDVKWDEAAIINGCRCKEFHTKKELEDIESNSDIYYIQSLLNEDKIVELYSSKYNHTEDDDEKTLLRGLVNELFHLPKLKLPNNKPIEAELSIDINNTIIRRRIGSIDLVKIAIVENIENNTLYKKSMWPFIK